jgi:multidrug efflux pump subunit AcrA (membrane-fusion protein)
VLDASGYVVARRQAVVSSKIPGKILEVLVEEGVRVVKDQIVAYLDLTRASELLARKLTSQAEFDFAVTPDLLVQGLIAAIIIGLVGGLIPAIRAVRIPVSVALREL